MEPRMKPAITGLLAFTAALALAPLARAETVCLPNSDLRRVMETNFGEVPLVRGIAEDGSSAEIWGSNTGGWTLVIVKPDGESCAMFGGDEMVIEHPLVPGKPALTALQ